MSDLLVSLVFALVSPEWKLFEPKGSIGSSSTDCEVKDLVDLDAYDTKQVTDGSWSELEHWMGLLI